MKYTEEIEIEVPIEKVEALFLDPDNYQKWMDGLESFELLIGEKGQVGAKTKFYFKMGKREITMMEMVLENNLPQNYLVSYQAKGVYNEVNTRLEKISEKKTRFATDQEFRFKGFMKLMGWLMPGAFKKAVGQIPPGL